VNYQEELNRWADSDHYDNNVRRIQLPYTVQTVTPGLTPEQQKERRKELARRLIEINARKREERVRLHPQPCLVIFKKLVLISKITHHIFVTKIHCVHDV